LSSPHSAKICHPPVFDYHSGIETTGGKFKKICTHNNRRSCRILKSTKYGIVVLDAMAVWQLGFVELCFDRF